MRPFIWAHINYFRNEGERVTITSPAFNDGEPIKTINFNVYTSAYVLMVRLPMLTGAQPQQEWRLFEPGIKFDQVTYQEVLFADGYAYKTVTFRHGEDPYVPMIYSNTTAYPAWTGSGRDQFASACTMSFQYRMDSPTQWGDYFIYCSPPDDAPVKAMIPEL